MANHEQTNNKQGPTDEYAVVVAYSSGEEAIIQAAKKRTGQHSVKVADPGSHEPAGTAVASPVARVKRNRWGV